MSGAIRRGNPVRTMVDFGGEEGLLVLGVNRRRGPIARRPGVAGLVARGSTASVLLVPV